MQPLIGLSLLYRVPKTHSLDIYFPDRVRMIRNTRVVSIFVGVIAIGMVAVCVQDQATKYNVNIYG